MKRQELHVAGVSSLHAVEAAPPSYRPDPGSGPRVKEKDPPKGGFFLSLAVVAPNSYRHPPRTPLSPVPARSDTPDAILTTMKAKQNSPDAPPVVGPPLRSVSGRSGSPWPWVVLIIVLALVGLSAFVFWRVETWPARTASSIASVFQRTMQFQPEVQVEQDVILEQTSRTAELSTAQRTLVVERGYESSWLLSTKRMRARGTFVAKAGFDLRQGVSVDVDRDAGRLKVRFPEPTLLTLDQKSIEILEWDNGLWNRLRGADAEQAVNELNRMARERAQEAGLLEEARRSVEDQLVARLAEETDLAVEVMFGG